MYRFFHNKDKKETTNGKNSLRKDWMVSKFVVILFAQNMSLKIDGKNVFLFFSPQRTKPSYFIFSEFVKKVDGKALH